MRYPDIGTVLPTCPYCDGGVVFFDVNDGAPNTHTTREDECPECGGCDELDCGICGNSVFVEGYDCIVCEHCFNAPVRFFNDSPALREIMADRVKDMTPDDAESYFEKLDSQLWEKWELIEGYEQ